MILYNYGLLGSSFLVTLEREISIEKFPFFSRTKKPIKTIPDQKGNVPKLASGLYFCIYLIF